MNIFYLHKDAVQAAIANNDAHVVKIPLEIAQMGCTNAAIRHVLGRLPAGALNADERKQMSIYSNSQRPINKEDRLIPYLPCHINHPCTIWMRTSRENWDWTVNHARALNEEYKYRYGKGDLKSWVVLANLEIGGFQREGFTTPALAMLDKYKGDDPVASYRNYYIGEKAHIASWKRRGPPAWWKS